MTPSGMVAMLTDGHSISFESNGLETFAQFAQAASADEADGTYGDIQAARHVCIRPGRIFVEQGLDQNATAFGQHDHGLSQCLFFFELAEQVIRSHVWAHSDRVFLLLRLHNTLLLLAVMKTLVRAYFDEPSGEGFGLAQARQFREEFDTD